MITDTIDRLRHLCEIIPPLLERISGDEFSGKPAPEKWSKKEILGHLIDSAANNHHRFIRARYENKPLISYDQNEWNRLSHYNEIDKDHLIGFWTLYNKQLIEIASRIKQDELKSEVFVKPDQPVTLEFIINDYLVHLEHHLKQLVDY